MSSRHINGRHHLRSTSHDRLWPFDQPNILQKACTFNAGVITLLPTSAQYPMTRSLLVATIRVPLRITYRSWQAASGKTRLEMIDKQQWDLVRFSASRRVGMDRCVETGSVACASTSALGLTGACGRADINLIPLSAASLIISLRHSRRR